MSKVKMINVDSLPNIPWQERPEGLKTESPVWRYSENPVMGRNPTPEIARIFNSAVVPWEDGLSRTLEGRHPLGRGTAEGALYRRRRKSENAELCL